MSSGGGKQKVLLQNGVTIMRKIISDRYWQL